MITEATASELRETGISVIGDVRWGTHFCYFYETKQDLLETLVAYFKAGLENNEFCVWVVSQLLTKEEARRALRQAVPDLERHLAEGDLELHRHDEWYLRDGPWDAQRVIQSWRDKLSQSSANGHTGLRASGDGGWVQNGDWMAFREYEKQVNALIAGQRSIILCTYPLTTIPGDQVFDVAHIHQVAVARRNGSWEVVETSELKEAKDEIRKLNQELEEKVEERTRELATTNEALRAEIAERKLAEEAVKQAEDRIRLVIDTIPTMAWSLRPDGVLDFLNQRWLDYAGLSLQEAIEEPTRTVHPEDLPRVMEKWLVVKATSEAYEDEMRLRRADGEYRWFLVRIAPLLDDQGSIVKQYGVAIDIEDRKQAEMAARALIDAIPQQIWSGPPDGTTDYCNDRWRSYTGLELEDVQGYGWQIMVHPEDRERVLKAWKKSVADGTPYEQEERHRGTDGKYRWFLSLGVPLRDAEGRIVRWYGTNTDIEDHKRAEEALRESEKLFAAFMDHLPGFAWMKNIEGRYVWVNKKEAELDAYRDGAIGKTDAELWPEEIASAYRANDLQVITTRNAMQAVEPSLAYGEQSYMMVAKFPIFGRDGSVVMVAGAGVDISDQIQAEEALRESETRFRQVAENISAVFWLCNPEETLMHYVSPAYEKIWGCSCDSLYAEPMSWMDSVHPDDRERIAEDERLHSVDSRRDRTYRIVRPDGSLRWIRSRAFPVGDEKGKLIRVAGIAEDITERKRAAKELEEANHQLRILSRQLFHIQEEERRHLARELHDEIGQTLTAAKINLKIIAPDVPAKVTGRLDDSIQLLDGLLRQVRELSLDLRPPLLDELGLVPTLRWLVDQQAQRAGLRVTFTANVDGLEIDPDVQTTCFRIAQEAITNIIRHSSAKSVAVKLRVEAERLTLSVRDDGVGFDPAAIQQKNTPHSSLGLVSMKERALLVRGGFEVHSAPGRGTEIRAWFPVAPSEHPSTETA
jgi:PAS domain S-box-containing protein